MMLKTAMAILLASGMAGTDLVLGDFAGGLDGWEERSFEGNTGYQIVELAGEQVLQARAAGTASALFKDLDIDLEQTPYLHWRWRIEQPYSADTDEHDKSGDDYPARLYVIRRGGLAVWRTRALNYVWSSSQPVGSRWPNAYAGNKAQMWALNSGQERAGEWVEHVRDVRADWKSAFGEDIGSLDGVAVMTDADDTGGSARAWYADIRFSAAE